MFSIYNIMNLIIGPLFFESAYTKDFNIPAFKKPMRDPKAKQNANP